MSIVTAVQRKVVDLDTLLREVQSRRAEGRTIVHCHGCFDIVHPGHIRYLDFARRQGDVLVVSLTGDSGIDKGPERPYISQELRAENLAAIEFVDFVYIDPEPTAERLLTQLRPDIYVKGKEYEQSRHEGFRRERDIVERGGGRVIFSSGETVFSSSALITAMPRQGDFENDRLHRLCARRCICHERMQHLISRFAQLKVVVVGDWLIDRYVLCDPINVASEAPVMSLNILDQVDYVGGAAIVARHAAALGADAMLISTAGNDAPVHVATDCLTREGVHPCFFERPRPSIIKTRYLVDDTKVLKVELGSRLPVDSVAERTLAAQILDAGSSADAVIFCDFGYGTLTPSLLSRVLPVLRERVPILTADVSGTHGNILNFTHVDLLCPTERELRSTLHDADGGLSSVAWMLMARTQARHLCVTLDKRGLVAFDRRSQDPSSQDWAARLISEHLPAFATRNIDRLGCGDALLAASTLALAAGADLLESAYLGNAAAALEIAQLGNVPITAAALSQWLSYRPELHPSPSPTPLEPNMCHGSTPLEPELSQSSGPLERISI